MSRAANYAFGAAMVAAAMAAGYWLGQRGGPAAMPVAAVPADAGAEAVPAASGGERKILYYRNPMGLPDTSPVPKQDSMGMDYIPVYEGEAPDDSGAVAVSPVRMQTLGVKTGRVERQVLDAAVRAVGRVEVNERSIHDVAPRFEGWIERLHVDATGDPVRRGQALFSVYSPELVSARKELRIAEALAEQAADGDPAAREGARRLAEAARERLRNWDVPGATRGRDERITFTAPASGIVLDKKAVAGMRFMPGEAIYRIADLSKVWVIADVYEQDLDRVAIGQRAEVTIDAFPQRRFEARLTYLYPTLNTPTRTTPVRLELDNPDGLLRPGMFAHVDVASGGNEPRLVLPESAVIDSGERQVVLLALGEGRFKPQPVSLGRRGANLVEVLEGVGEGDEVVISANFLIDAESNLKAALAGFSEAQAALPVYEATGSIEDVFDDGSVMMKHDPIPALQWPAMTMEFGLASKDVVAGIAPGEALKFRFEDRGNGEFVVIEMKKAATQ